jgi:hypothetical protein
MKSGANPYVVILDWRFERANALRMKVKADAIGSYSYQRDGSNAPFAQLAQETEEFWEECRKTGSTVVPIVMTGWDRRPRVERPVFWETSQQPNVGIGKFYHEPTPAELSNHLADAVAWVRAHPHAASAKVVLIYAWNENDEGGWLVPTSKEASAEEESFTAALVGFHATIAPWSRYARVDRNRTLLGTQKERRDRHQSQSNESAVRDLLERWAVAVRAKNMSEILANHSQDFRMFDVPLPFQSRGLAAYEDTWKLFYSASPNRSHSVSNGWRLSQEMMWRSRLRICSA